MEYANLPFFKQIFVGDMFYKNTDNGILMVRLIKIKNPTTFRAYGNDKKYYTLKKSELENEWTKLRNDGYLTYTIVDMPKGNAKYGLNDVIIRLHRRSDLEEGKTIPYAVCRQCHENVFATRIIKDNINYIGCSMSIDSCPPEFDYNSMLSCEGIKESITISVYRDDTLSSLLSWINLDKYNAVLGFINKSLDLTYIEGSCKTVKELMICHEFKRDFCKAWDIEMVPFVVDENLVLTQEQITYLEDMIKHVMNTIYIYPYASDIDVSKIQRSHITISDLSENIYIIAYDEGEYINRQYETFKDKRDVIEMLKLARQPKQENSNQ